MYHMISVNNMIGIEDFSDYKCIHSRCRSVAAFLGWIIGIGRKSFCNLLRASACEESLGE